MLPNALSIYFHNVAAYSLTDHEQLVEFGVP